MAAPHPALALQCHARHSPADAARGGSRLFPGEKKKNHLPKNTDEKKPSQFDFIYLKACKLQCYL